MVSFYQLNITKDKIYGLSFQNEMIFDNGSIKFSKSSEIKLIYMG